MSDGLQGTPSFARAVSKLQQQDRGQRTEQDGGGGRGACMGECDSLRCNEALIDHKQRSDALHVPCLTIGQSGFFMHADVHT